MDYYKTLNVEKNATPDDIKKSYRKLAMKYHPDRNKDDLDAEKKFKEATQAYEVLSDPNKRAKYDQYGTVENIATDFSQSPFEDLFSFFGSFSGARQQRRTGSDATISVLISLEDSANGARKQINYQYEKMCQPCKGKGGTGKTCSSCNGQGKVQDRQGLFSQIYQCPRCTGKGFLITTACKICHGKTSSLQSETVVIEIPPGISNGETLILRGYGHQDNELPRGSLKIRIKIQQHKVFQRENSHLLMSKTISFVDACLGTKIKIKSIYGDNIDIQVPKGTQFGQTLRVPAHGMPHSQGKGDLFVRINIEIPQKINDKAADLLRKFRELTETKKDPQKGV